MTKNSDVAQLLQPLFDYFNEKMEPASSSELDIFRKRAAEHHVPDDVVTQLADFYSIMNGVPCLDSLDIHSCEDMILFEWWDHRELWIGQRDFYVLRWSQSKNRFCIGDASEVSFSASDEYCTFAEAVRHLARLYESPASS